VQEPVERKSNGTPTPLLSNAEIADRLASLAQLLSTQKENPYKVKAYHRAAARIRNLPDSLDDMVRREEDLTQFPASGAAIASAIREIVTTGTLAKLERLRSEATPAVAALSAHPRLDPRRVMRVYKKLKISSVEELAPGTSTLWLLARVAYHRSRSGLMVLSAPATSAQLGLLLHAAVVMTALKL
jgi:hypothetical protein